MTTFVCQPIPPCQPICENPIFPCPCPNEKDAIISSLKKRLFDLQQQERDLEDLSKRFNQLKRDFDLLNEQKHHVECELKQRDDAYNQKICNLRGENENLQIGHNEKMSLNKKLFAENDNLAKAIDLKCCEIQDMTNRINDLTNQLNKLLCDKKDLECKIQNLKNIRDNQDDGIMKLIKDNQKLSQICQDQEEALKQNELERKRLNDQIKDKENEEDNLHGKLRAHGNNVDKTNEALRNLRGENDDLENNLKDYENQFDNFKKNNDNLRNDIDKEKALRNDREKQNENIKNIIDKTEKQIDDLGKDYENLNEDQMQTEAEERSLANENERLKDHASLLTSQNSKLLNELGIVHEQNNKMKELLSRKGEDANLLRESISTLEGARSSMNGIEQHLSQAAAGCRVGGPCIPSPCVVPCMSPCVPIVPVSCAERCPSPCVGLNTSIHCRSSSPRYTYCPNEC